MKFLIISTSLNPESRSALLAHYAYECIKRKVAVDWVDLRELALPLCDGNAVYDHPTVKALNEQIQAAEGVLIATPIYNYSMSASAKNLLELTGNRTTWNNKTVSFLCAAGGQGSYMSIMPFANSLMLDFRCTIVPDFVYAHDNEFDQNIMNEAIQRRIERLASRLISFTQALCAASFGH